MFNFTSFYNTSFDETTLKTTLANGLDVYICKKPGFKRKVGLFGTKYGSIINEFVENENGNRIKVPDGIAHFLEHKLFEQEGANALDLFAKIGVSSNAYTSFDQTVYYFDTIDKFDEAIKLLVRLVKTPYFTKENVDKEQGIIGQEITMYDDNPNFIVYFNTLRAMYKEHPIRIDIAGTVDSIAKITKDTLYTCYNTFYNPKNMFFVVVGDVDEQQTVTNIENSIKEYEKDYGNRNHEEVQTFIPEEDVTISESIIEKRMDIYMPQICIGYKLNIVKENEILKRQILADFINEMYFSKLSPFFEKEYDSGVIMEPVEIAYEGSNTFAHILIMASSNKIDKLKDDITNYIEKIKTSNVDEEMFQIIKRKKIGENIFLSENLNVSYRRIIGSIVDETKLYEDSEILNKITPQDVSDFLYEFNMDSQVVSIVREKE